MYRSVKFNFDNEGSMRDDYTMNTGERGKSRTGKTLHYKGSHFHKVIPDFAMQGGDITTFDGTGGDDILNYVSSIYFICCVSRRIFYIWSSLFRRKLPVATRPQVLIVHG